MINAFRIIVIILFIYLSGFLSAREIRSISEKENDLINDDLNNTTSIINAKNRLLIDRDPNDISYAPELFQSSSANFSNAKSRIKNLKRKLKKAIDNNNTSKIAKILKSDPSLTIKKLAKYTSPLEYALVVGKLESFKYLYDELTERAKSLKKGAQLLLMDYAAFALYHGQDEIFKYLAKERKWFDFSLVNKAISQKAEVANRYKLNAICAIALRENKELLDLTVNDLKINPDETKPPVTFALLDTSRPLSDKIFSSEIHTDEKRVKALTFLFTPITAEQTPCVNPNLRYGKYPYLLDSALKQNFTDAIALLLNRGADPVLLLEHAIATEIPNSNFNIPTFLQVFKPLSMNERDAVYKKINALSKSVKTTPHKDFFTKLYKHPAYEELATEYINYSNNKSIWHGLYAGIPCVILVFIIQAYLNSNSTIHRRIVIYANSESWLKKTEKNEKRSLEDTLSLYHRAIFTLWNTQQSRTSSKENVDKIIKINGLIDKVYKQSIKHLTDKHFKEWLSSLLIAKQLCLELTEPNHLDAVKLQKMIDQILTEYKNHPGLKNLLTAVYSRNKEKKTLEENWTTYLITEADIVSDRILSSTPVKILKTVIHKKSETEGKITVSFNSTLKESDIDKYLKSCQQALHGYSCASILIKLNPNTAKLIATITAKYHFLKDRTLIKTPACLVYWARILILNGDANILLTPPNYSEAIHAYRESIKILEYRKSKYSLPLPTQFKSECESKIAECQLKNKQALPHPETEKNHSANESIGLLTEIKREIETCKNCGSNQEYEDIISSLLEYKRVHHEHRELKRFDQEKKRLNTLTSTLKTQLDTFPDLEKMNLNDCKESDTESYILQLRNFLNKLVTTRAAIADCLSTQSDICERLSLQTQKSKEDVKHFIPKKQSPDKDASAIKLGSVKIKKPKIDNASRHPKDKPQSNSSARIITIKHPSATSIVVVNKGNISDEPIISEKNVADETYYNSSSSYNICKKSLHVAFKNLIFLNCCLIYFDAEITSAQQKEYQSLYSTIRHFALQRYLFGCIQALKMYKNYGGHSSETLDAELLEDQRNMLIHADWISTDEKTIEKTRKSVLETAQAYAKHLPNEFRVMRKPNEMKSVLSKPQLRELLSITQFKREDIQVLLSQYQVIKPDEKFKEETPLAIEQTPLYQLGAAFHIIKAENSITSEIASHAIINHYIPHINNLMQPINKRLIPIDPLLHDPKLSTHTSLHNDFYFLLDALKMLLAICGELSIPILHDPQIQNPALKIFARKCKNLRDQLAHCFDDIPVQTIISVCQLANKVEDNKKIVITQNTAAANSPPSTSLPYQEHRFFTAASPTFRSTLNPNAPVFESKLKAKKIPYNNKSPSNKSFLTSQPNSQPATPSTATGVIATATAVSSSVAEGRGPSLDHIISHK